MTKNVYDMLTKVLDELETELDKNETASTVDSTESLKNKVRVTIDMNISVQHL